MLRESLSLFPYRCHISEEVDVLSSDGNNSREKGTASFAWFGLECLIRWLSLTIGIWEHMAFGISLSWDLKHGKAFISLIFLLEIQY